MHLINFSSTPQLPGTMRGLAVVLCLLVALSGCGKKPPEAINPDNAADQVGGLFDKSPPEVKALADRAVQAMANNNLPEAHMLLQTLMSRPELTPEQLDIVTGAFMGVGEKLRESAETGDEKAQEFQRLHQSSK
jgi:hypothetical protein